MVSREEGQVGESRFADKARVSSASIQIDIPGWAMIRSNPNTRMAVAARV
jgi:hypothetical protein